MTQATISASTKALVIDDDPDFRSLLRLYIGDSGHVLEAAEGRDGLWLAQTERPDLVFLDLSMPGAGGEEVLRRLRENSATQDLPVVVVTGLTPSPNLTRWFSEQGVDLFLKDRLTPDLARQLLTERARSRTSASAETQSGGDADRVVVLDEGRTWLDTPAVALFRELSE